MKAASRIGPHSSEVLSVIVGSLLGDCYGNRRSVEGTRLCYRQSVIHKDYLFWLYKFFSERGYCSNLEPRMYTRKLKKGDLVTEYIPVPFGEGQDMNLIHLHLEVLIEYTKCFIKRGKRY